MIKVCFGCGIKLQTENPNNIGYIPLHKYEDSFLCQRCFKLKHYGVIKNTDTPKTYQQIINNINKDNKFVIFITDFLSINKKCVDIFKSIKNPKVFVVSKADIIPLSVKNTNIIKLLKDYYEINDDIKLVSSHTNYGVEALIKYLDYRKITESYIVGLSNAGKSNLINVIIDKLGSNLNKLTTSNTMNTTLDFVRLKINNDLMIIDTPGFTIPSIYTNPLTIKGEINPRIYQMKTNETLKIQNFYLSFSANTNITLFIPNEFKVNKYFKEVVFKEKILIEDNKDLIINGIGFINIKQGCTVSFSEEINVDVIEIRDGIFGEYHE